jgi:hypothetical protein
MMNVNAMNIKAYWKQEAPTKAAESAYRISVHSLTIASCMLIS